MSPGTDAIRRERRGFVLIELVCILVTLAMFITIASSASRNLREKTYVTVDLANLRQILRGSAIYNSDNEGRMAHPTWGSDLTGPDGWAYLTANKGRVPGAASVPGSCAGRDVNTAQFTNQLAFFKKGQVTQHLPDVKTAWCPKDVATRGQGPGSQSLRAKWLTRPVKVTSYAWNGTLGGYPGRANPIPNGLTYKVSQFLPTDWQMWEADDRDGFNFNDAADNPENTQESQSLRHTSLRNWWIFSTQQSKRALGGGAVVGTFDGAAKMVQWSKVYDLRTRRIPSPNEIMSGPQYRF